MSSSPQYSSTPNAGTSATLTAANTALDGTGATGRALIFTAGSAGSILPYCQLQHLGTNSNNVVLRFFLNNGADPEVAGNNSLIKEVAMASNTVSQTAISVAAQAVLNIRIPASYRVYVTLSQSAAAGIRITPINGGNF